MRVPMEGILYFGYINIGSEKREAQERAISGHQRLALIGPRLEPRFGQIRKVR
jgi:hypothetical protein